jgi:prepilin-type N-terminal cleavage/methylation domain-containing protein
MQMFRMIHKRMKGEKGFTLIELLVVIIIIAILAAIAIPTFLGQRQKAQDASSKSLVRNAMTAIESAYVDNRTFDVATMTAASLVLIEPAIVFNAVAVGVPLTAAPGGSTSAHAVGYFGAGQTYQVGSLSESTNAWAVAVNKGVGGGTVYYKNAGVVTQW